jgi:hypothetical protein
MKHEELNLAWGLPLTLLVALIFGAVCLCVALYDWLTGADEGGVL